jgi:two-component sensor histidine kinase
MSEQNGQRVMPEALKMESDHRIANNLAMLSSLMRLHAAEAARSKSSYSAAEVGALLRELSRRVETVASLHRILAGSADESLVRLDAFLPEICNSLCSLSSERVTLSVDCICDESIEAARALPIGLVVAELITNSVKYAHPSGVPSILRVVCRRNSDGSLCIAVSADGVGYPEGFDALRDGGLGFRVMRSLAVQLNAELQFTSDEVGASCKMIVRPRMAAVHPTTNSSVVQMRAPSRASSQIAQG